MRDDTWFVKTDYKAPKGRIYAADPGVMPEAWKTIVPEAQDVIESLEYCGRQDLCEFAEGCEDADGGLLAGRQARGQHRV